MNNADPTKYPRATVPEFINPLTRREQFAAMAMQGMLASHKIHTDTPNRMIAEDSVRLADALIEALEADQ
jgi:hypothetical protein